MTNTAVISRLLEPARLGALRPPNRLVMAPMTRTRAGADGVPEQIMATYYGNEPPQG
jgi:N-ethylmaleimide reductase